MTKNKIQMKPSRAKGKSEVQLDQPIPLSPVSARAVEYKKALFVLPVADLAWIQTEIDRHRKDTRMRVNKSQLIQIAVELLRRRGGLRAALKEVAER